MRPRDTASRMLRVAIAVAAAALALSAGPAFAGGYYPSSGWTAIKTLSDPHDVAVAMDGEVFVADATGRRIAVYSAGGSFLREFDGTDVPGGELVKPVALAIGPDSLLYVADRNADRISVFERSGAFVRSWGSRGSSAGQFLSPADVTFDAAGLVYVADTFNDRVQVFDANGVYQRAIGVGTLSTPSGVAVKGAEVFVTETNTLRVSVYSTGGTKSRDWGWSTVGTGPGSTTSSRYLRPAGVEVDSSGDILVLDAGRHLIERCSTAGVVVANYGTGSLAQPDGLFVGAGGALTIADTMNQRIVRMNTASPASITLFAPQPADIAAKTEPKGVAAGPAGETYITEALTGKVKRVDANGAQLFAFSASPVLSAPTGIAALRDGSEVFVCDTGNNRIVVYSSAGAYLRTFGSAGTAAGQFSAPSAIAEQIDGTLAVVDTGNDRIQVFYPDGTYLYTVGVGRLRTPSGVAAGTDGRLYVADTGNHRIAVFQGDGTWIRALSGFGSGIGQLHSPSGIAFDRDGDLVVVDRGNNRMQWFTTTGTALRAFGARGSGPGEFWDPHGVAVVSADEIAICDTGNSRVVRARLDVTAPVTSAGSDADTWVSRNAVLSLSPADAHSGVAITYYRIGAGSAVKYTGPVTFTTEGETSVSYWSVDRAGNTETPSTVTMRIDRFAPTGSATFGSMAAVVKTGPLTVQSFVSGASEMRLGRLGSMGTWIPYAPTGVMNLSAEGATTLIAEYRDLAGNLLTQTHACIVDGTGPTTTLWRTPASGVSTGPVTVDLSAVDALTPVTSIRYKVDGGAERVHTGSFTVSGDGLHSVEAWAIDTAGNAGPHITASLGISRLADGGSLSIAGGQSFLGYRTLEVSTTIQSATRMRWDAGSGFTPWQPFLATWYVTFPADGERELTVQFEDALGQQVELTGTTIIDLTAPVTTLTGLPPSGASAGPVMLALDVADASPSTIRYSVDGGTVRTYSAPFTVTGDGTRTIRYHSEDAAGNIEAEKTASFIIASTPPNGSITVDGGRASNSLTRTVRLVAPGAVQMRFDTGSGPGAWMPFAGTATVQLPGEGLHWITATFANIADVRSDISTQVLCDLTPPTTSLLGVPSDGLFGTTARLTLAATDALSGVATTSYRVDAGPVREYTGDAFTVSGDGLHAIEMWSTDTVGNTAPVARAGFRISRLALGGILTVADGASRVATTTVPVSTTAAGATLMRWDAGSGFTEWRPFSATWDVTFPHEGTGQVTVQFRNELGVELQLTDTVIVDLSAPVTSILGLPPTGASSGPVLLALDSADVSPVSLIEYSLDDGAWRPYSAPFVVSGNGVHRLSVRATDALGNREAEKTSSFVIAGNRPEGSVRVAGGRSFVNTTTVSLECSVPSAARMRFDTGAGFGAWAPYARTAKVTMPGPGLHWIVAAYRNVAEVETTLSVPVLVDLAGPVMTTPAVSLPSFTIARDRIPRYAVRMSARATDAGDPASGMGSWRWRLGSVTRTTGSFTGVRAGRHSATVTAYDRAANSTARSATLRVGAYRALVTPTRATSGRSFAVKGGVPSAGTGAAYRVLAYRRASNGAWVLGRSVAVKARVSRSTATISSRVALSRGTWRIVLSSSRGSYLIAGSPSAPITVK